MGNKPRWLEVHALRLFNGKLIVSKAKGLTEKIEVFSPWDRGVLRYKVTTSDGRISVHDYSGNYEIVRFEV